MANRLTQIATRTGDDGTTGLGDGTRVRKNHLRIAALGDVDELNSHLGVLLAEPLPDDVRELLVDDPARAVQPRRRAVDSRLRRCSRTTPWPRLDEALAHYNAALPRLKEFILPAGTRSAALAHVAPHGGAARRARGRRAGRAATPCAPKPRQYLNRLSDLLFVLARVLNRANLDGLGGDDVYWKSERLAARRAARTRSAASAGDDRAPGAPAPRRRRSASRARASESSQPRQRVGDALAVVELRRVVLAGAELLRAGRAGGSRPSRRRCSGCRPRPGRRRRARPSIWRSCCLLAVGVAAVDHQRARQLGRLDLARRRRRRSRRRSSAPCRRAG